MIKAIDTKYHDTLFRSRLEARWAVFFDELGIHWEYECEGYRLSNGMWYLPDFWLPFFDGGMFVEVKPYKLTDREMAKCECLCNDLKKEIWLAVGVPAAIAYSYLEFSTYINAVQERVGIPKFSKARFENRMYVDPEYDYNKSPFIPSDMKEDFIDNAVSAARQARFEHLAK